MPLHDQQSVPKLFLTNIPEGNPVTMMLGESVQVALRYNLSHWQKNEWNGAGWVTLSDETLYDPPIPVRGVKIKKETDTEAVLQFDLAGYGNGSPESWNDGVKYQTEVTESLPTGQVFAKRVTRVHLTGSDTTATEIHLSA